MEKGIGPSKNKKGKALDLKAIGYSGMTYMMWGGYEWKLFQETRRHTEYQQIRCTEGIKDLGLEFNKMVGNKYDYCNK